MGKGDISDVARNLGPKETAKRFDAAIQKARANGASNYGNSCSMSSMEDELSPLPYPELSANALYGVLGELTKAIAPHTEADPAAVLSHLLVAFGNLVGASPYFEVSGARHSPRVFVCVVGKSAKGRKGSSWAYPRKLLCSIDAYWSDNCQASGLSSGEGLIHAVRDPVRKLEEVKEKGKRTGRFEEVLVDPGVDDKRLLVIEEESARVLKSTQRESNILSTVIRSAWDTGNLRSEWRSHLDNRAYH